MSARLAVACCVVCAGLLVSHSQPAAAQADAHARALARTSCQSNKHSDTVTAANAAVGREPNEIGPRMRLADALVDQGCYQEAVGVLEAIQATHPRNIEISAKLRAVRSLVSEQSYIEGLTDAAEGAKLARNQLRCTRLADVQACDDALQSKPDDVPLLLAKGDALMQANRPADAVTAYRHASQLKPGDDAVQTKLTAAEALQAKNQPVPASAPPVAVASQSNPAPRTKAPKKVPASNATVVAAAQQQPAAPAPQPNGGRRLTATPSASVAALTPPENKTYSNDAPPGQTN